VQLREAPQAAPDTRRGPPLDEHRAVPPQHEPRRLTLRPLTPLARRRKLGDAIALARLAVLRHGTDFATRVRARADSRAEIHQRLRISLDIALRQQILRLPPQR